ncbi:hypothetical protein L6452_12020 [Arctium lappa]|uniref:Uncharacterized protein n=1 Tax=Arctium lappa TaxID=4217 RepID=A0ACB9DQP2_ARCLA|nr:hypothetical protein L6452_12020 [Arctium lappa]
MMGFLLFLVVSSSCFSFVYSDDAILSMRGRGRSSTNFDLRVDILKATTVDKHPMDMEGMEATMERLLALIDDTYKYVDDIVGGRVAPDYNVGRFISEIVSSIPKLSLSAFDKLVNDIL